MSDPGVAAVAVISWQSQSKRSGGTALALRCSDSYDESHWQTQTFGPMPDHKVTKVRPLVVIDPESAEDVERLADALACVRAGHKLANAYPAEAGMMQTALREFAAPTPPRPDEPQGLGAVVEDANGVRWVRSHAYPHWTTPARSGVAYYDDIKAVRVLSEGVTP